MTFWHFGSKPLSALALAQGMEDAGRDDEERPLKVVKLHGRPLVERWIPKNAVPFQGPGVDGELPPFIQNPPEAGKPALETNHAYHCKNNPCVLGQARCNNDIQPIFTVGEKLIPLLLAGKEVATDEDWEEAKASMLRAVNDAEFYCSEYSSSKEQPHINGLLCSLYRAMQSVQENLAQRKAETGEEHVAVLDHAKTTLRKLVLATYKRMHKGFPEMISYLLGKRTYVSSHTFTPLLFSNRMGALLHKFDKRLVEEAIVDADEDPDAEHADADTFDCSSSSGSHFYADYMWRPQILDLCPWYFFQACTSPERKQSPGRTWPWREEREEGILKDYHPCRKEPERDHNGEAIWHPDYTGETYEKGCEVYKYDHYAQGMKKSG